MAHSIIGEGMPEGEAPISAINVTSLVDVMICLLIIFIVATPDPTGEKVEVAVPAGRGDKMSPEDFLYSTISVAADGKVFLGTLPLSQNPAEMQQELANNAKIKEDGLVLVQGDENVPYDRIVDVLKALQAAEIPDVGFVTDPDPKRLRESGQ